MSEAVKFMPIAERDRIEEITDGELNLHLNLPIGVDTERILVNVPRLHRLGRLAGATELSVVTADDHRPGFELNATDVRMQADGSATLVGLPKRPKKHYAAHEYDDSDNPMRMYAGLAPIGDDQKYLWLQNRQMYKGGPLAIYLNKSQIESDIRANDSYSQGLVDVNGWSRGLNRAAKAGLIGAVADRYLPSDISGFMALGRGLAFPVFGVQEYLEGNYRLPVALLGITALRRAAQLYRLTSREMPPRDFNPSIFTGYRIDRAAITAATAKTGKLFKVAA